MTLPARGASRGTPWPRTTDQVWHQVLQRVCQSSSVYLYSNSLSPYHPTLLPLAQRRVLPPPHTVFLSHRVFCRPPPHLTVFFTHRVFFTCRLVVPHFFPVFFSTEAAPIGRPGVKTGRLRGGAPPPYIVAFAITGFFFSSSTQLFFPFFLFFSLPQNCARFPSFSSPSFPLFLPLIPDFTRINL